MQTNQQLNPIYDFFTQNITQTFEQELCAYENNPTPNFAATYPTIFNFFSIVHKTIQPNFIFQIGFYAIHTNKNQESSIICTPVNNNGLIQLSIDITQLKSIIINQELSKEHLHILINAITTELQVAQNICWDNAEKELPSLKDGSNWNMTHPFMFQLLLNITHAICLKMQASMPNRMAIGTSQSMTFQALAVKESNGTSTIIYGKDCIKKYLFEQSTEKKEYNRKKFEWIIAHELGHLHDPLFNLFATKINPILSLNKFLLTFVLTNNIFSNILHFFNINVASIGFTPLCILFCVICIFSVTRIAIHRLLEFNADALSLRYSSDSVLIENCLQELNHDAAIYYKNNVKFIGFIQLIWAKRLHPSVTKRISYLKKLINKP